MPDVSWLQLLQALQAARSNDAINAALAAIAKAARADFITGLARKLQSLPREGHEMVLEDAESLLNEVLFKLSRNINRFRGTSDAEAQAFVRMIFTNTLRDASKTALRRKTVWQAVLGYLRGQAERQRTTRGDVDAGEEAFDDP